MIQRGPELRLAVYCLLLYSIFITWGYLQEKITSTAYVIHETPHQTIHWDYPTVLNLFMTITASLSAWLVEFILHKNVHNGDVVKFQLFWRSAMTAALASPIGYQSLKFISYPMMILTKSSKHVPVMIVGKLFYKQSYEWYKYFSVLMICGGIALFTIGKGSSGNESSAPESIDHNGSSFIKMTIGLFLILLNLSLDGITNNEQDKIFKNENATSMQMMKYLNTWQALYLTFYLLVDFILHGYTCNVFNAFSMMRQSLPLLVDLVLFCICGCVGQVIMFGLIKEFGSLIWITVSVTRQLFTILLSVFIFNHTIEVSQWMGIVLVFSGLGMEIFFNYYKTKSRKSK